MALYKRGKVWWMSFICQCRQVRRSTETSDKRLAKKIYAKVQTEVAEGKWFEKLPGESKTVRDLLETYINEYSVPNKASNSVRTEKGMVKEMTGYFGNLALKEVTPRRVTAYKARCREKGLAPSSIRYRLVLLNHAFNLAVREWEWLRENPLARVSRVKVNNERDRWLTFEEENKLLDACILHAIGKDDTKLPRYWLHEIVIFALNTGMRQDEILSLEWPHVDLFRKTATVVRSKNGEKRTIPMNRCVSELLQKKAKVRHIRSNLVFASKVGTKIHHRNLRRAFYKALDRVEIEDFRFHDLRHTFATRLVQAGIDLYKVARLLGHKDVRMTQRYAHHYPESLRDGVEVLDAERDRFITILSQSGQIKEKGATVVP